MNSLLGKIKFSLIAVSLFAAVPLASYSQPARPARGARSFVNPHPPKRSAMTDGKTSEKSIAVDKNVTVQLCVTQGTVKINGWNRGEVRVFIKDGAKFGFKVTQKSMHSDAAGWIKIVGLDPGKGRYGPQSECIWGDEIEIDAPAGASINMSGTEATTTIDGIKKAAVKMVGGDISLRNIAAYIYANSGRGDITVEESTGSISLETATGNILAFDVGPWEIGDGFKARTNSGMISLQKLEHRQVDAGSVSGSIIFNGEILSGGSYGMNTTKGSIKMSIPANSSCQLIAFYGFGNFNSDIPVKIQTEDITEGATKRIAGVIGNGGATVRLTSNSGNITIKKQ